MTTATLSSQHHTLPYCDMSADRNLKQSVTNLLQQATYFTQIDRNTKQPQDKLSLQKDRKKKKKTFYWTPALSTYTTKPQQYKFVLTPSPTRVVERYSGRSKSLT